MTQGDGTGDFRSLRLKIILGIPIREFDESSFRNNFTIRDLGGSRGWEHNVNYRKRVLETSGTRRESDSTIVSTRIGRTWIGLGEAWVAGCCHKEA